LDNSESITDIVARLLKDPNERDQIIANASKALEQHRGAIRRTAKTILEW
jgi:3-deoxy-D-manno-octulosonic-acid transferase